ncbi:MAG: transglycosylase SLT domain-containing protein [Burkholderiaceae bacterium]
MMKRFSFLPHLPLGVVIAAGGLVMGLSEEPAARPLDNFAVGTIKFQRLSLLDEHSQPSALSSAVDAALIRTRSAAAANVIQHRDTPDLTGLNDASTAPSLAFLDPSVAGKQVARQSDANFAGVMGNERLGRGLPGNYDLTAIKAFEGPGRPIDSIEVAAELAPALFVDYRAQLRNVSEWLARYYRVDKADVSRFVRYAHESGERNGVDPWLITAVMSIESSLNPRARSHKDARGLMQVLVRAHTEKFEYLGGVKAAFEPRVSVEVGTRILRGMIDRTGSVEKALKHYVGAANLRSDGGYGAKVIRQRDRIWAAAHGKTIPRKPALAAAIRRVNLAQIGIASQVKTVSR